jgi:hypothetical protein
MFKNLHFLEDNNLASINIVKYQDKWSQIKLKLQGDCEDESKSMIKSIPEILTMKKQ